MFRTPKKGGSDQRILYRVRNEGVIGFLLDEFFGAVCLLFLVIIEVLLQGPSLIDVILRGKNHKTVSRQRPFVENCTNFFQVRILDINEGETHDGNSLFASLATCGEDFDN